MVSPELGTLIAGILAMSSGLSATAKSLREASLVVWSLVLRLRRHEIRTWNGVRFREMVVTIGSIKRLFSCLILFSTYINIKQLQSLNKKAATCKFPFTHCRLFDSSYQESHVTNKYMTLPLTEWFLKGIFYHFFKKSNRHYYLFQEKVLFKDFGTYAKKVSEVIKDNARELSTKESRPLIYLDSSMYGFRRGFPFRYKSISTDVNGWANNWIVRALVIKCLSSWRWGYDNSIVQVDDVKRAQEIADQCFRCDGLFREKTHG